MAKRDWMQECNEQNVPLQEFGQIFCVRCRNPECIRAGYAGSVWADRMGTQVERLLENPKFADLTMPQYAKINALDFPDALRQALRIEIARKKGDWEVPGELTDEQAMAELASLTAKETAKPVTQAASLAVTLVDEAGEPYTAPEPPAPEVAVPAATEARPAPTVPLNRPNTPFPVGGVMLPGGPAQTAGKAPAPVDPWAVAAPVENVVAIGAKIRLGFAAADAAEAKK